VQKSHTLRSGFPLFLISVEKEDGASKETPSNFICPCGVKSAYPSIITMISGASCYSHETLITLGHAISSVDGLKLRI
jgi:hypothetical protein